MRAITHIVVHCSATPEGRRHNAEDLRRWHKQKGWSDIGYHHVVLLDGSVEPGRPESVAGAHVAGHNSNSIGVVYIGGVAKDSLAPKDTRTQAQKSALLKLLKQLKAKYPSAQILGHRDFKGVAKACPCFNAKPEYASL